MNNIATQTSEELRERNKVQLVSGDHEGAPLNKMPAGFYGFTFSPASFEAPLFFRNSFLSFEVHRVGNDALILGYVEPEVAAALEGAQDDVTIDMYPVAKEKSTALVAITHSRMANPKPPDRAHSNRMRLTVKRA